MCPCVDQPPGHRDMRFLWLGTCLPLVLLEPANHLGHLGVSVYPEAVLLCDAGQLHVLRIQLLLHDLLQCLQNKGLRFFQRQGSMVLGLKLRLRAFAAGSDGLGIVAVEGA